MIARMFLFEVRYWLRQPMVYIFLFVNALLTFKATASDGVQIGGGVGNVVKNAPYVVYIFYGIMSFIALLMVTAFVNGTAIRDFTSNTAQIIFSTPVSKSGYLIGKFLGSTFVASIPLIGVSLGIVVGSWMPWVDPLRVGPNYLYPHVQGFLVMGLPNILFSAAIIFAVAVIQRSTMASFITAIVLFVGYSIASSSMEDMDNQTLAAMLDPFGTTAMSEATQYWTVDEKNLAALPVSGLVLWNRLLWIGVSALVFLFGYSRFSFTDRVQKAKARVAENDAPSTAVAAPLPKVALHFDRSALRRQWSTLYRTELVGILKSTPFIIIMVLGLAQLFTSLSFVTSMYGNTTYPVTYSVVDMISGNIVIYVMIIVVFYGGQLIWKERDPKFDGIINALPMATRTGLLAKLAALITVVFVVHLFAVGAGMTTQLLNGYTRLEPLVYLTYFVVPGTLFFAGWAAVALLVHVLVNNKYLGFFVFIVLFILNTFAWTLVDVESNLVLFNGSPGLRYSDMNGFGPYLKNWLFLKVYWILFAGLIVLLSYLFVVRGNDTSMRWRIHQARQRFRTSWPVAAVLGGAWLLMAGFGYYQTKVLNTYQTSDVLEEDQVRYEKEFKRYEHMAQPHYTAVNFTIDLDPPARMMSYSADITLKNKHTTAIDTLWLNVPHRMNVTLEIPGAELVLNDDALDQRMYRLSPPLAAGAELSVKVSGGWKQKGIENETEFTGLVQNGSFFNNMELLPSIGYNTSGELQDRADRRKHGLPPNDRMPKLTEDPAQRMQNYLMAHSDWMTVRTTISTSPDQIAIAPGSLKKEWTADGKRYFQYELDHKALNFFSFMSARYEVAREKWNDVDLEVYYQKEHAVNVPRMLNSMRKALTYYTENFGPYANKQARIIEFPRYASFAQAFPGTMPYSESIGFITDLTADEDIDMVFYVVAHEMGHQWWAHQVIGADMQGSTMLSESMAQYSALMVMEREYGRTHMRKFLKYESDKYQEARGGETIGETPLMFVENQGYIHYNKASVLLYCMREFLGEDTVNKAFRALVDSFGYAEPPWPTALDMYRELRKVTPDSLTYLLEDHLKYITLYDNRVLESTAHLLPDSSYEVTVKLTCEKNHADSLGRETPAPMNDWIDVGLLKEPTDDEEEGAVITFQRVRLRDGENTVVLRSEELPAKAAIDPMHLFFDRVPTDNTKSVVVK
ncbi:MAG: ABC transporter permease [Flavobacteriales bacterium]|nr:ABC transporter permease [Flavobacteriales bacterium]